MRCLSFITLLVFLLFAIPVSAQRLPDSRPLAAPIPCKERTFSIPFDVRVDGSADPVKNVELLVSKDRGGQWHSAGKKPVEAKIFEYVAEDDGELWFTFRTITLSGTTRHSGGGPTIRVLVDATKPVLTLDMKQQESGEMLVSWQAEDRHIQGRRPDFAVTSDDTADKKWKPLSLDGKHFQQTESGGLGSFLFWPENEVTRLELRAGLEDRAGNRSEIIIVKNIKPVHRAEAERKRDAEILAANFTASRPPSVLPSQPLQPPKPMRMTKTPKEAAPKEMAVIPPPELIDSSRLDIPETSGRQALNPAGLQGDALGNRNAYDKPDADDTPTEGLKRLPPVDGAVLAQEVVAQMAPFVEMTPVAAQPTPMPSPVPPIPAVVPRKVASPVADLPAPSPTALSPPTSPQPGKILGITMNTASNAVSNTTAARPQIIVKWQQGDAAWQDAQMDVFRRHDSVSPWFPVATNLPNSGEYWWYVSTEDLKPFYIMLQMRSLRGGVQVDATKSPIRIDPKSLP